jgi:hypothetical protein
MRSICISILREYQAEVLLTIEVDGRNPYGSPQSIRPAQLQSWMDGFLAALSPIESHH